MKYTDRFNIQTVDEWRKCYLNYKLFKNINILTRDCLRQYLSLNKLLGHKITKKTTLNLQIASLQVPASKTLQKIKLTKDQLEQYRVKFKEMADQGNEIFNKTYERNLKLYEDFTQFKYRQIVNNFTMCKAFVQFQGTKQYKLKQEQFILYLEHLYTESHFLALMIRSNLQALGRIVEKHRIYCYRYFQSPSPEGDRHLIKIQKCNGMKRQLQLFYTEVSNKNIKSTRARIQLLARDIQFNRHYQSFFIGILGGTVITIIIFMWIILQRAEVSLQNDPIFNQYFGLWRGISHYIFYIWMLGSNIFYFQRYKISHKIILQNRSIRYPKSNDLFKIGSFFSVIFIICFIIYALQIADILDTPQLAPQWLPMFVWVPFILFLFNPFPILYSRGRLYIFKMLFKIAKSIITLGPPDLLTVIATTQLFALINAFQDTTYFFCFYTNLKLPLPLQQIKQEDICKPSALITKFVVTLFLYSLRMLHCLKGVIKNWGKQPFYKTLDFLNFIKFSFGLSTTILSYLWRQVNNQQVFPAWLVCAIITALYSFVWDVKVSFDVLNLKSKNFLLRDEIIFPKVNYYVWIISTFFLRCTWALYISPNIVRNFLGSPEIFILAIGYLQIIRRGIWNNIRLQLQQIRNRQALRAVSKQKQTLQQNFYKFLQKNAEKINNNMSGEHLIHENEVLDSTWKQKIEQNKKKKQQIIKDANIIFEEQAIQTIFIQNYRKENKQKINHLLSCIQ